MLRRLILLSLGLACGPAVPQPKSPAAPTRLSPCHGPADRAECGSLDVPEDPRDPGGRAIRLQFVVLRALEPRAKTAPLFHLDGGPGIAAIEAAVPFYLGPGGAFRRFRDIVIIDQRGTGQSAPLRCPEIEARSALVEQYTAGDVAACRARLAAHADLSAYGTTNAAIDLDRVRAALGYDRIDLWALSYGTQLAQVYLRDFPGRVRRAVLVGVAPLDFRTPLGHAANAQRVLDALFDQCQADGACQAAFPRLRERWQTLLQRVETGALPELRRGPFAEGIRRLLGTTSDQRRLPSLIDRAAAGDPARLLAALRALRDPVAEGLYLSNACAEGTLRIAEETIPRLTARTFLGDYRVRNQLEACRRWPVEVAPATFFAPVPSGAAVLVLSGGMDATTPPTDAREVCAALGDCRLVSFPLLAHGIFDLDAWRGGDCFDGITLAFYEAADPRSLDTSCASSMTPPPFVVEPDP